MVREDRKTILDILREYFWIIIFLLIVLITYIGYVTGTIHYLFSTAVGLWIVNGIYYIAIFTASFIASYLIRRAFSRVFERIEERIKKALRR